MKAYLKNAMQDLKNRGLSLKRLIPHPLKYQALSSLADRCSRIIDIRIHTLDYLLSELENRSEDDIRDIFRGFRICAREIEAVEYYGISSLYYETEEIEYMNKLVFRLHQEINLPLTPPSMTCISTSHYCFFPFTNIIITPIGEVDFLLHLPDLLHEIGHEVLLNKQIELRLQKVDEYYNSALTKITEYYQELLTTRRRGIGPQRILRLLREIHSQWKECWIEEFFCDLFALYTLGPAYAWSHFHLTAKKSEDAFNFPGILIEKHPSDESRMRLLLRGLEILGFEDESEKIKQKWNSLPLVIHSSPDSSYQYAYPNDLMEEIANLLLNGMTESNFTIITPEELEKSNQETIISILNAAWIQFWENPDTFRQWEENAIQTIKTII